MANRCNNKMCKLHSDGKNTGCKRLLSFEVDLCAGYCNDKYAHSGVEQWLHVTGMEIGKHGQQAHVSTIMGAISA